MSHYTRTYDQPTRKARDAAALEDCREYLGESRFKKTVSTLADVIGDCKSRSQALREMKFGLAMFVGIEGRYPVRALYRAACARALSRSKRR